MKTIYLIIMLFLIFALFSPSVFAQDHTKLDLPEGAIMRLGKRNINGVMWGVESVCFSPDGRKIASGGLDGTVRLWDTATRKHLKALIGHCDKSHYYKLTLKFKLDRTIGCTK